MKILAVVGVLLLVLFVGCVDKNIPEDTNKGEILDDPENDENVDETGNNGEIEEEIGFDGISKTQCEDANGFWNECGSPCAGTDAEMCIQVCRIQCECGGIAGFGCPEGYTCLLSGKVVDEMGVCVKN